MSDNNNDVWGNLEWSRKVELCEQSRANENSLLHSYLMIFIAVETILFAAVFAKGWNQFWGGYVALLGLMLAILWGHVCELSGNRVDRWEEKLNGLWKQAGELELTERYRGAVERRERRRKQGRLAIFLGWGHAKRFLSARWVLIAFMPFLTICLWIWVMVSCFTC